MSELIINTLRLGLPASFLRALVPQGQAVAAEQAAAVNAERPAAPVIDRSRPDTGSSSDRELQEQLRSMAALHYARTAQEGSTNAA